VTFCIELSAGCVCDVKIVSLLLGIHVFINFA
jgi:hypothetical protein